jgi:AcrR family transcriptional regulator
MSMSEPLGRRPRADSKTRKPREERWTELREVAAQIFFEKGYEAASLQDIADRLGILKGSLYYYIQSKEDLLFAVVSEVHAEGLAIITGLAEGEGTPLERLERVLIGHVEHECRNLLSTAVFLHEMKALSAERQMEILGEGHPYLSVFRRLVEEAIAAGEARSELDPALATLSILGSTNGVYRWFQPSGRASARRVAAQIAEQSVLGIATAKGAKARAKRSSA